MDSPLPDGKRKTLGAVEFVRRLEEVLIRTCADFAIPTKRVPGLTGVWTDPNSMERRTPWRPPEQIGEHLGADEGVRLRTTDERCRRRKIAAIGVHISRFVTSHGFALNVNTDLSFFNLIVPCGITSKPVTSMQQQLGQNST